jgi:hypothetical protein
MNWEREKAMNKVFVLTIGWPSKGELMVFSKIENARAFGKKNNGAYIQEFEICDSVIENSVNRIINPPITHSIFETKDEFNAYLEGIGK